ncbi:MAG: glycosyltransferase family 2 protein [Puniceicoccaceae bacterium]|nr:MAG: glycosyltransferase family 2 protein [Puniceicoccaceae bacterium]
MKLIIQIPCFNEAEHLAATLAELPKEVPGFDSVEVLVIDDGSSDDTASVARSCGVRHIVRHTRNQGLARAFESGLAAALKLDADVVVNTDADNQYCAADIPKLTQPILDGEADIVIGERPIASIEHFSPLKKLLQKLGSAVVRGVSGTDVADAPSGFRAFSRPAAQRMHVFNDYTYTLETIIQAGQKGIAIRSVPIRVNGPTRESRLVKSIPAYVRRSIGTMVRIFITYRPLRFFTWLAVLSATPGVALGVRFLYRFARGEGEGMIQSLILAALLIGTGFLLLVVGLLADLISANRKLLERANLEIKELADEVRQKPALRNPNRTPAP